MSGEIHVKIHKTRDGNISVDSTVHIGKPGIGSGLLIMYAVRHLVIDRINLGPCSVPGCEACKEDMELATKIAAMFEAIDAGAAH